MIQLDDIDLVAVERVRELAFRIIETSDGNFQAWLAVLGADEEIERRLKVCTGADVGANGATRVAGSLNVKEQRRRGGSYPRVKPMAARSVTLIADDLAGIVGLGGAPPCVPLPSSLVQTDEQLPMPDYDEFVQRARLASSGEIDRSAVDYAWAATALRRGHSADVVMRELERVSLKAASLSRGLREAYVRRTVKAAANQAM